MWVAAKVIKQVCTQEKSQETQEGISAPPESTEKTLYPPPHPQVTNKKGNGFGLGDRGYQAGAKLWGDRRAPEDQGISKSEGYVAKKADVRLREG